MFKPEDFDDCWHSLKAITYQDVANRANELLKSKSKKVYTGKHLKDEKMAGEAHWSEIKRDSDLYEADLINIKELERE